MEKLYVKYANRVSYKDIIAQFRERTVKRNEGIMEIEWDKAFNRYGRTPPVSRKSNLKQALAKYAPDIKLIERGKRCFLAYNWYNDEQFEFGKQLASQPTAATVGQADGASLAERIESLESKVERLFHLYLNRHAEIETAFKYALNALRCLEPDEGEQEGKVKCVISQTSSMLWN